MAVLRDILVPLDGSGFAEAALPIAAKLARSAQARLHLVLAHQPVPPLVGVADMMLSAPEVYQAGKDYGNEYLAGMAAKLSRHGIAEAHEVEGRAGPEICEEALRLDADLVVMATHGRGALRRLWLGSVADYVIRHLSSPVLLIRPARVKAAASLRSIAVALDLSRESEAILAPVASLAHLMRARVTLLHVVQLNLAIGWPPAAVLPDPELLEASRAQAGHRLETLAGPLRAGELKVSTRVIEAATAAGGLLAALEKGSFDLIALTTHGQGGMHRLLLGSVADKVIRAAGQPVLVLRPADSGLA
jgi:nucleotide-binding universal stress UspA family protein